MTQRINQREGQRLPPRTRIYNSQNQFDIDLSKKPAGMAYKFVAARVAGAENRRALVTAEMNGWTPVPAERHPEVMGLMSGALSSRNGPPKYVEIGDQILVEQPEQYAEESKSEDDFAARYAVESQIKRLGLESRRQGVKQPIRRTMEQITVGDDD